MTDFAEKIYQQLSTVAKGKVTTYKYLAQAVGSKAYRAVGQVLRSNPYAPHVPCHRVVSTDGTIGGFMGMRIGPQIEKKKKLLRSEGIRIKGNKILDFSTVVVSRFPRLTKPQGKST